MKIRCHGGGVVRKSEQRLSKDMDFMISEEFQDLCRNYNPRILIRKRKMPLHDLLLSMITRKATSLTLELRNYMKISHPGTKISKPGYLKQRMKLNPEAFKYLFKYHNKNFYADSDQSVKTFRGYILLGVDGTTLNIPTTSETLEVYGDFRRKNVKPYAMMGLGCIYDSLNNLIIEADIQSGKFNENALAQEQAFRIKDTIGNRPFMLVMDRGYPSLPLFMRFIDGNIPFVARLSSYSLKKEQESMKSNDEDFIIKLTSARIDKHVGTPNEEIMRSRADFPIRIVRVKLNEDTYEYLATNLSRTDFPEEDFKEIYHLRWKIETTFGTLKNRLQIENFTGTKPVLLEQDVYSTIYICNLAEDIIRDIESEQEEHLKNDYKHPMAINRAISIGILKNDLIYIFLQQDQQRRSELMQQLYEDLRHNLVPIRPDRQYDRTKGTFVGKYHNTYKKVF